MKERCYQMFALVLLVGMTAILFSSVKVDASQSKKERYVEGEAIVMYRTTVSNQRSQKNPFSHGISVEKSWDFTEDSTSRSRTMLDSTVLSVATVKSNKSTKALIKELKKDPSVLYVEPNYKVYKSEMNDTYYSQQWYAKNTGQNNGTKDYDIDTENFSKNTSNSTGKEKVVAVVDTGIDATNEDLMNRLWTNQSSTLKGTYGYDFVNHDLDPSDDDGHGTHCAGIIGAQGNNEKGIAGIAQNKDIKLMALKVLDEDGAGDNASIIDAYYYIYKQQLEGVNIVAINDSWGGSYGDYGEDSEDAILKYVIDLVGQKGAVSVCAAGNESSDSDSDKVSPAGLESDYIISVAATDGNDQLACFSNYGKDSVDIAAPGTDILSTVSYNCFNPTIYGKKRSDLCQTYYDYNDDATEGQILEDTEYNESNAGTVSVEVASDTSFGSETDGKSMKISLEHAKQGESYIFYAPYKTDKSTTPRYVSAMVKAVTDGLGENNPASSTQAVIAMDDVKLDQEGKPVIPYELKGSVGLTNLQDLPIDLCGTMDQADYWNHMTGYKASKSTSVKDHAVVFIVYIDEADGDFTFYIDNIGVSKGNVSQDEFGKYDFYNGTSMATPTITGAVASIACKNNSIDAIANADEVLSMTRRVSGLSVGTKGTFDGRKLEQKNPIIRSSSIKSGKVQINGANFGSGKGTVKVDGKVTTVDRWSNKTITLHDTSLVNKYVNVEVVTASGLSIDKDIYFAQNKSSFKTEMKVDGESDGGKVATDGSNLYYLTDELAMYTLDREEEEFAMLKALKTDEIFSNVKKGEVKDKQFDIESELVYSDGSFYVIIGCDLGYEYKHALLRYNVKKDTWSRVTAYETKYSKNTEYPTLAAYNGTLYVIGGLNSKTYNLKKTVYTYRPATNKWGSATSLPEGRFASLALQSGNQLVVTLGGDGSEKVPVNLVYSDKTKKWTKKSATVKAMTGDSYIVETGNKNDTYFKPFNIYGKSLTIFTANIGLCKDGLAYTGLETNGYGDTFTYSVSKDRYSATSYQLKSSTDTLGTTIKNKFYVFKAYSYDYDDDQDSKLSKSSKTFFSKYSKAAYDYGDDEEESGQIEIQSIPISNGQIYITSKAKHGKISGSGYHLPGQSLTVTAKPKKGYAYKPKTLKVGSKKIKGSSYTFRPSSNVVVKATFVKSKISLNYKSLTRRYGTKVKLKATVKTVSKTKSVKWKVSNKKYASVSKKGVVTLKKKGRGKTVTVTATAKDGSKVRARCKIRIR